VVIFFGGEHFLVDRVERGDFFGGENFVVMLDNFLKFTGKEPLTFATGTDFDFLAVVFDRLKKRITSGTFHN
jgi:hypothetical protein